MRILHKKGVSPLIATVLLIAFAVSLGAVIMNLGVNLSSKCDAVDLEIHTVNDQARVCYDQANSMLRFTVNNKGDPIDGYRVEAVGDAADSEEYFNSLVELAKDPRTLSITGTFVRDVSLIPYLDEAGKIRVCSEKVKEYTNIPNC